MRFFAFSLLLLVAVSAVDEDLTVPLDAQLDVQLDAEFDAQLDAPLYEEDNDYADLTAANETDFEDVNATIPPTEEVTCLEDPPTFKIVGTPAVQRLTQAWKEAYMKNDTRNECDKLQIEIEGHSWAIGAARVCGNHPIHSDADMAGMSGPFYHPQADTDNGWSFDCKFGSKRKTTLVRVGYEGVAILVGADGIAAQCIRHLGGSLSRTQLRWIFSTFTLEQLIESGADKMAIRYPDEDKTTRLWSELHPACEPEEIAIGWVRTETAARDFLVSRIMKADEYLDTSRPKYHEFGSLQEAAKHIITEGSLITFLRLGDLAAPDITDNDDDLKVIDIQDKKGMPHSPDPWQFSTKAYPLSRPMYLGVWDNPSSLELTTPFIDFGLSAEGTRLLKEAGFWSILDSEKLVMRTRLELPGGMPLEEIMDDCGREYASITMAGSPVVAPVARLWSEMYQIGCPTTQFDISEGGSTSGAKRVCGVGAYGKSAVDIGNMARKWREDEAVAKKKSPYVYDCQDAKEGQEPRTIISLDIGKDGITIIVKKGGIADECQEILGGFTMDQLRWIYSSYSEEQLALTGWNPKSVANSDGDPNTHFWSELDPRCEQAEIHIMGDHLGEGTHHDFRVLVMKDMELGEDIDVNRPNDYVQAYGNELLTKLQAQRGSIAYVGFSYYQSNQEKLSAVPIKNRQGVYVAPSIKSITDGTYDYLVRTISMNLWDDPLALRDTIPFLQFGFDHPDLQIAAGLVPLEGEAREQMKLRLASIEYDEEDDYGFDSSGQSQQRPEGIFTVLGSAMIVLLVGLV